MKNSLLIIAALFFFIACTPSSPEENKANQKEPSPVEQSTLRIIQKRQIEQPADYVITNCRNAKRLAKGYGWVDFEQGAVLRYATDGTFLQRIDPIAYPRLGKTPPLNFTVQKDSIFLLFLNKIVSLDLNGTFGQSIHLQLPEGGFMPSFEGGFHYRKGRFYIGLNGPAMDKEKQYSKPPIAVFDYTGTMVNNFGSYPDEYHKKNIKSGKEVRLVFGENEIALLPPTGYEVYFYNYEGELLYKKGVPMPGMDYTLKEDTGAELNELGKAYFDKLSESYSEFSVDFESHKIYYYDIKMKNNTRITPLLVYNYQNNTTYFVADTQAFLIPVRNPTAGYLQAIVPEEESETYNLVTYEVTTSP